MPITHDKSTSSNTQQVTMAFMLKKDIITRRFAVMT